MPSEFVQKRSKNLSEQYLHNVTSHLVTQNFLCPISGRLNEKKFRFRDA